MDFIIRVCKMGFWFYKEFEGVIVRGKERDGYSKGNI